MAPWIDDPLIPEMMGQTEGKQAQGHIGQHQVNLGAVIYQVPTADSPGHGGLDAEQEVFEIFKKGPILDIIKNDG